MPEYTYTKEQIDHIQAALIYHGEYCRRLHDKMLPATDNGYLFDAEMRDQHLKAAGLPVWDAKEHC